MLTQQGGVQVVLLPLKFWATARFYLAPFDHGHAKEHAARAAVTCVMLAFQVYTYLCCGHSGVVHSPADLGRHSMHEAESSHDHDNMGANRFGTMALLLSIGGSAIGLLDALAGAFFPDLRLRVYRVK